MNKCWESDLSISEDDKCPHITRAETPKVIIPQDIWHKIMGLTTELDTEWLGYLGASKLQSGEWKVTDLRVPKQEVSTSTVKPTETFQSEGVIHSHANMGAFFSGVDDDYLNENHDFSIVVNKDGDTKAVARLELPCGSLSVIEAEVEIESPEYEDAKEFIEEAKKNIEEEQTTTIVKKWKPKWEWDKDKEKWNKTDEDEESEEDPNKDTGVPNYVPKKKKQYSAFDPNDEWPDYWNQFE